MPCIFFLQFNHSLIDNVDYTLLLLALLDDGIEERRAGFIGIEVRPDIVVKLILGKMDGDDLRHGQKADDCLLQLSVCHMTGCLLLALAEEPGQCLLCRSLPS